MGGNWSSEPHKDVGLHRRMVSLMPETYIREALTSARDAVDDGNAGKNTIGSVSACSCGAVWNVEERGDLNWGINWKET